jgi:hypothetical protein
MCNHCMHPEPRTDAIGTTRSRRQSSTAASNPRAAVLAYPARPNNSATRSRFCCGVEGWGGFRRGCLDCSRVRHRIALAENFHGEVPHCLKGERQAMQDRTDAVLPSFCLLHHEFRRSLLEGSPQADTASTPLDRRFCSRRRRTPALFSPRDACKHWGRGSSENHESAINRPVPEGHMTSPPQRVSIPRTASATYRPNLVHQISFSFFNAPNQTYMQSAKKESVQR